MAEKTRALKELAQLYPDVNPLWREWVYDVCVNTPPDQLETMKRRIAVNPGKHANPCGGVLHAHTSLAKSVLGLRMIDVALH